MSNHRPSLTEFCLGMAWRMSHRHEIAARSGWVVLATGLLSSLGVYFGHDWFHGQFLPALGIEAALGDALGGFAIIFAAFIAQRVVSLAVFDDAYFGLFRSTQQLRSAKDEMQAEIGKLDRLANTDRLTGAWNRRGFEEMIDGEINRLARYEHEISMLVIDIDHFKSINDNHGHNIGDRVLVELSALLKTALRASDSLTRWGGEEFIVLCPSTPLTTAIVLAERLRENVAQTGFTEVGSVKVSVGVAECLVGEEWRQWLGRADAALYRAKKNGRNQVQFSPETTAQDRAAEVQSSSFVQLSWRKAYESGHADIELEHQALFAIANDLLNAVTLDRPAEIIQDIIYLLMAELKKHFRNEEAIIAAVNFPGAAAHGEEHSQLLAKAEHILAEFESGTLEIGSFFQFLVHDMIAKHILMKDREYFPYLKQ